MRAGRGQVRGTSANQLKVIPPRPYRPSDPPQAEGEVFAMSDLRRHQCPVTKENEVWADCNSVASWPSFELRSRGVAQRKSVVHRLVQVPHPSLPR